MLQPLTTGNLKTFNSLFSVKWLFGAQSLGHAWTSLSLSNMGQSLLYCTFSWYLTWLLNFGSNFFRAFVMPNYPMQHRFAAMTQAASS